MENTPQMFIKNIIKNAKWCMKAHRLSNKRHFMCALRIIIFTENYEQKTNQTIVIVIYFVVRLTSGGS